jgi:hypothetical protein
MPVPSAEQHLTRSARTSVYHQKYRHSVILLAAKDLRMSLLFGVDIHRPNTMADSQLRMSQAFLFLVRLCNDAGPAVVIGAISTNMWTSLCVRGLGGDGTGCGMALHFLPRTFGHAQ